ncbi:MAG TPA: extracellular solute-binding protein [Anaerolineales bacterium]
MKNRKTVFALVSALVALAIVLAACAPAAAPTTGAPAAAVTVQSVKETVQVKETVIVEKEKLVTPTPAPAGPVTITFWHGYNADVETPFVEKTIIPAFEAAHPNIKVQSVQVPYDQFRRKLLTAIAGGTAPDLIRADIIWVPEFADMGALAPLDQVMKDFNTLKDSVFPGPLSTNFLNDHYYGLPLDTNTRVLVYNKDMFAAAKIDKAPATIDEFLADCEKIKALGPKKYCFADGGTYAWAVNPWIWSFGGDLTDPGISKATGFLNGADSVAAFQFLKDALDKGYIHPGIKGGGLDTWGSFGKDEVAMILEGPWFPPSFTKQFPNKQYGLALMPAGKGGSTSVVGGEDIVMFQQSQNKEAAAEFIRFMLSMDTQTQMASVGQMPVLKAASEGDNLKKLPDYFGIFLEQLKTAKARTPNPAWSKMEEVLTNAGAAILAGKVDVQKSLDDAAAKIDPLIAKPK